MNNKNNKHVKLRKALANKLRQLPPGTKFACTADALHALGIHASKGDANSLGHALSDDPAAFHLAKDYHYPNLVYDNKTSDNLRHYVAL